MKRKPSRQGTDGPTQAQATLALAMAVRGVSSAIDAATERVVVVLEELREEAKRIGVRMGSARGVMVIDPHGVAKRPHVMGEGERPAWDDPPAKEGGGDAEGHGG